MRTLEQFVVVADDGRSALVGGMQVARLARRARPGIRSMFVAYDDPDRGGRVLGIGATADEAETRGRLGFLPAAAAAR